jgi:hypothetical protein
MRPDAGMATVELAAALPVLVLLLGVGLGALDAARLRIICVDAAREGARVAARADDAAGLAAARRAAPAGAAITISRSDQAVTVEVRARAAVLGARIAPIAVAAAATAALEPGAPMATAAWRVPVAGGPPASRAPP